MLETLTIGILAAVFTASFSALGGFLVFFKKRYNKENIIFLLNVAAGIMLASSFFTLLAPAVENIKTTHPHPVIGGLFIIIAILLGFSLIGIINLILPHEHKETHQHHGLNLNWKASWLFVIAIAIHKFPEGFAIGVAYAGHELFNPKALALGIAIQNIPEGLMVAVTLIAIRFSRIKAALFAALTGLIQPIGAAVGILSTGLSTQLIPLGMAMAGGCMLFVIINEVLPETYTCKTSERNAIGIFLGFLLMTYLSVTLE